MTEPRSRRPGALASLRPRVAVPRPARGTFAAAVPCIVSGWALGGLYLSLGPSLAAQATNSPNLLWGGLVIFLICGTGAAAALALRGVSSRATMLTGCLFLLAGMAVTFGAIATTASAAFLAGTAIAGVGFGLAFLGSFRMITALAEPDDRARCKHEARNHDPRPPYSGQSAEGTLGTGANERARGDRDHDDGDAAGEGQPGVDVR